MSSKRNNTQSTIDKSVIIRYNANCKKPGRAGMRPGKKERNMFEWLEDIFYDHPMVFAVAGFVLVFYVPIGVLGALAASL